MATDRLSVRSIDPEVLARAHRRAELEDRSLSAAVRTWLEEEYARPGITAQEIREEHAIKLEKRLARLAALRGENEETQPRGSAS